MSRDGQEDGWEPFDRWEDDDHVGDTGWSGLLGGLEDDPRVQAGLEHLQRAAHEAIAASRALLDVAEELVDSPGGLVKVFGALGQLGEVVQRSARGPAGRGRDDDGPDTDPPVQRIPVS